MIRICLDDCKKYCNIRNGGSSSSACVQHMVYFSFSVTIILAPSSFIFTKEEEKGHASSSIAQQKCMCAFIFFQGMSTQRQMRAHTYVHTHDKTHINTCVRTYLV